MLWNWIVRKVLTERNLVWIDNCGCHRSPDCFGKPCPNHY